MKLRPGMEWPPAAYQPALDAVRHDKAWLTGDTATTTQYVAETVPQPFTHRAQYNGGLVGGTARAILGPPQPRRRGQAEVARHLPVAAELTETVGDLMFGNAVGVEVEGWNPQVEQALRDMVDSDTFTAQLVQAGQKCSALGWEFGRVVWNTNVSPHPWIEWVDADKAFATYEWGCLTEVTFVDEWETEKGVVYRLTQTHRAGEIEYQLWHGDNRQLGHTVPYTEWEPTAYLAEEVTDGTKIYTGVNTLTAVMVPNREVNPAWDGIPELRNYGKSDIQFAGGLWADIDKLYTDFIFEIDSARARLLVSEDYLQTLDPGQGSVFDWFRDVYMVGATKDETGTLERVQFDIRVQEYMQAIEFAVLRATGSVGLSSITVGMDPTTGNNLTATEIRAKSEKTTRTWRSRSRYWRAGLQQLLTAWGHVDALLNGLPAPTTNVTVTMQEPVQDTDLDRAQTAEALRNSGAASVRHLVTRLHPEWSPQQVEEEVAEIRRDQGLVQIDPLAVGGDTYPEA